MRQWLRTRHVAAGQMTSCHRTDLRPQDPILELESLWTFGMIKSNQYFILYPWRRPRLLRCVHVVSRISRRGHVRKHAPQRVSISLRTVLARHSTQPPASVAARSRPPVRRLANTPCRRRKDHAARAFACCASSVLTDPPRPTQRAARRGANDCTYVSNVPRRGTRARYMPAGGGKRARGMPAVNSCLLSTSPITVKSKNWRGMPAVCAKTTRLRVGSTRLII